MSFYQTYLQTVELHSNTPEWWKEIRQMYDTHQTIKTIFLLQTENQKNRQAFKECKQRLDEIVARQTNNDMFEEAKKINDKDCCEKEIKTIGLKTKENSTKRVELQQSLSFVPEQNEQYQEFVKSLHDTWITLQEVSFSFLSNNEDMTYLVAQLQTEGIFLQIKKEETVVNNPPPNAAVVLKHPIKVSVLLGLHLLWHYLSSITVSDFIFHGSLLYLMTFFIYESKDYIHQDLKQYVVLDMSFSQDSWIFFQNKINTFFSNGRWKYWIVLLGVVNYLYSAPVCSWLLLHAGYVVFCVV